jgi:hypothetical protein
MGVATELGSFAFAVLLSMTMMAAKDAMSEGRQRSARVRIKSTRQLRSDGAHGSRHPGPSSHRTRERWTHQSRQVQATATRATAHKAVRPDDRLRWSDRPARRWSGCGSGGSGPGCRHSRSRSAWRRWWPCLGSRRPDPRDCWPRSTGSARTADGHHRVERLRGGDCTAVRCPGVDRSDQSRHEGRVHRGGWTTRTPIAPADPGGQHQCLSVQAASLGLPSGRRDLGPARPIPKRRDLD